MNAAPLAVVLTLAVLAAAPGGCTKRDRTAAAPAIEAANKNFSAAVTRRDAAAVAALYTNDALVFPPNAPLISGRAAIERYWRDTIASGVKDVGLTTTNVETSGDVAIEAGSYQVLGDAILDEGKYLVVWKHDEGTWKLHRDMWNSSRPAGAGASEAVAEMPPPH